MKYSTPHSNLTVSISTARRIRWGSSKYAPYWGSRYGVITNPTAGSTYTLVALPEGYYYWCFGWHIMATADCRIAVRDSLLSRQYFYEFLSGAGRSCTMISPTPLFGCPNRITGNNKIELWVGTSFTGNIYYVLLGIDSYDSDYEDVEG